MSLLWSVGHFYRTLAINIALLWSYRAVNTR